MLGERHRPARRVLVLVLTAAAGCDRREPPAPAPAPPAPATPSQAPPPLPARPRFPALPRVPPQAAPGQRVLAPAPSSLEAAPEQLERAALPFYAARVIAAGPEASRVETPAGHQAELPNALIVPLPAGAQARRGDFVLTSWASGAGLRRAIVIGGPPERPSVRYLPAPGLAGASTSRDRVETVIEHGFRRIEGPGDVGASLACGDRSTPRHFVLLRRHAEQLLAIGRADRVAVFDRSDCVDVPLRPAIAAGSEVQAPLFGRFRSVRVRRIEPELGRVTASYPGPGGVRNAVFAWLDVLPPG